MNNCPIIRIEPEPQIFNFFHYLYSKERQKRKILISGWQNNTGKQLDFQFMNKHFNVKSVNL